MSKVYFALVFDHAFEGEKHVVYEIGGGMCGSGFPDYDLYFSQLTGDEHSQIRRAMFTTLANSVKHIFLVNTFKNYVLNDVGREWLQQFPNVHVFKDFNEFTNYALSHRETWNDAVVVLDTLADVPHIIEDDLAATLAKMQITIPVLNTGVRHYDDKMTFTTLFSGKSAAMLTPTWLVDTINHREVLNDIKKSTAKQFIIKLTSKSTARDTVIIAREHLPAFIKAAANKDARALARIPLPATDKSCLQVFISDLPEFNHTYIIRECIMPNTVMLGGKPYLPAARSVVVACYDTERNEFDFVKPVANYWQRPERPYYENDALCHANLITANIQKIKSPSKGITLFSKEETAAMHKACQINPAWTDAENANLLPDTIEFAKFIMRGIAAKSRVTAIKEILACDPNANILCRYLPHRLNKGSLVCDDEDMVKSIASKTDAMMFMIMQTVSALRAYFSHQRPDLLPKPLFIALNSLLSKKRLPKEYITSLAMEFNSLSDQAQLKLVTESSKWGKDIANLLKCFIDLNKQKTLELLSSLHKPAMDFYKAHQYKEALNLWSTAIKSFKLYKPCHPVTIAFYYNLADCYLALNELGAAGGCYKEINGICERTNNQAELLRLAVKQAALATINREQAVSRTIAKFN